MVDEDWKVPEEWHYLEAAGTAYMVDSDVRKEVEAWLKNTTASAPNETIVVETILGETATITSGAIAAIYDSTPELRRRARMLNKFLKNEREEQGFAYED